MTSTDLSVALVVGARPEFTKVPPIERALDRAGIDLNLIHTGQHYDTNMSGAFFAEFGLRPPRHHLGVGSGTHGAQTAAMLAGVEDILLAESPGVVLVIGDTNSTLAGALAAAKLHIPVGHIEAGLRSFNMAMPEELNRRMTDHISTWRFCPSEVAVGHLRNEGITEGVHDVGDVMRDAVDLLTPPPDERARRLDRLGAKKPFALATVHRAENTDNPKRLSAIIDALDTIGKDLPVVLPLHPRTKSLLPPDPFDHDVAVIEPVGYLDALTLAAEAEVGLTDSGGLQKELYWLGTPCVTMRDETEWVETVQTGWNTIVGADPNRIVPAAFAEPPPVRPDLYGDGTAAEQISAIVADGATGPQQ